MTFFQAIFLGIIEGFTEFLPISSTGHMILVSKLFGIADADFTKTFEIVIQSGAILAVLVLYWKKLFSQTHLWKKVLIAFLPTAVIGFLLYKILKSFLLQNVALVLWSLFLGGIVLIVFEWWNASRLKQNQELNYQKSFLTGLAQSLAIIPGVSRSGATIVAGLLMGIRREDIIEFSFLLAIPTMLAATGYDLLKSAPSFSLAQFDVLLVGFFVSFVVAMLSIVWFLRYIKNHSFVVFGVYRIMIAIVFYLVIFGFKV
jgi:undecaprenyl-diphosphatase